MLRFVFRAVFTVPLVLLSWAPVASAQDFSNCSVAKGLRSERRGEGHTLFYGSRDIPVQIDCKDMQFMADFIETFNDKNLGVAQGNVVFESGGTRISADRMEFNFKTKTGVFYNASGTATMPARNDQTMLGTQPPDAYFWGDDIHKLGPKKYRLIRGNFTTCVQPTPRWDIGSSSVTINLDDYALLRNSIFRVKGVPLMYLPLFYYPIQEDDRATGFLIPTYGSSTIKGQTISNAFFWAISRSQDATLFHDWFSKTGQGVGGEYRYVLAPGSQGNSIVSWVNEKATTYRQLDGSEGSSPATRSYSVRGDMIQGLPFRLRGRASVDYFSSIRSQQRLQQDVYRATNRQRRFGGNITGSWGGYVMAATLDRSDIFYSEESYQTSGSLPKVVVSRGERRIGKTPLYFGVTGEYGSLLRSATDKDVKTLDQDLMRLDVLPVLRIPFTKWSFLTANSSVAWRGTYWTESLEHGTGVQVPEPIGRKYFDLQTRITGPVFNRIWNTPGNGFADKFKHVIEPSFTIQRVTAIDEFPQIVKIDGTDYQTGGVTRITYGVNNRLYAKKDHSREILNASITQSRYSNKVAAQFDPRDPSGFNSGIETNYTPVFIQVRATPTEGFSGEFGTELDSKVRALRTLRASGTFNRSWISSSAGWSRRRFIKDLPGFNDPKRADHYLNASVNLRRSNNRIGGMYSFNYDLLRDNFLQQRYTAYYNAQCCGIGVEYQTFNFQNSAFSFGVPQDRRFNLSFTLAGIGTFSNLFGAFGGQQR
jgi:LPS-assembly protein